MKLIRTIGSLKFASCLLLFLVIVLILSTSLESLFGTPFASKFFYQARWFDAVLGLVGLNILVATLYRFPFKKRHSAFLLTHVGILLVLAGALVGRLNGVEGQLSIAEGDTRDDLTLGSYELAISGYEGKTHKFDIGKLRPGRRLELADGKSEIVVQSSLENAVEEVVFSEGGASDPVNHAAQVTLVNDKIGIKQTIWLSEGNPFNPHPQMASFGPFTVRLAEKSQADETGGPRLEILNKDTGEVDRVDLKEAGDKEIPLGKGDLKVKGLRYIPNARVVDSQLVNVPEGSPNPAVQFEVYDNTGKLEKFTRFAFFPDFGKMHNKDSSSSFNLKIDLILPPGQMQARSGGPVLSILFSDQGWEYKTADSQAELSIGKLHPSGWMDFSFQVNQLLTRALIEKKVVPAETMSGGKLALETSLIQGDKTIFKKWILANRIETVNLPSGKIQIGIVPAKLELPFSLKLLDFRKVDYPGTRRASAFESDVVVQARDTDEHFQYTISMNNPLDYAGFRIFQSSYSGDPSTGESSVFTIAKNPGIPAIYAGCCIMFLGVFLLFYVKPLSSMGVTNGSRSK